MNRLAERLLASTLALLLVAWCLREDVQPDLYFHLTAGRHLWETKALPDRNVFLALHRDHPFIDHEWLFQAIAWPLYVAAGPALLTFLKTLVAGGCLAALAGACSPHGPALRWVVLVPATLLIGPRLVLRPEVVAFACAALVLWRLQRDRFRPTRRSALLLAGAQVVWSNSHGTSLLGPIIVGAALAGALAHAALRRARRDAWLPASGDPRGLALLLLALLAATLLNPYGPRASFYAVLHVATSRGDPLAQRVVELTSPFALLERWEVRLAFAWVLAAAALWLVAARRGRARLEDAVIGAGLAGLGLLYARNLPFVALGLAVPTAAGLRAIIDELGPRLPPRARPAAIGATALVALVLARETLADRFHENGEHDARAGLGLADFVRYDRTTGFLRESPPAGGIFNTFGMGHALGWAGLSPFINGNVDLYPRAHRLRYYALVDGAAPWDEELRALGVTDAVLDHRIEVPAFFDALLADPGWVLVHADEQAVVVRRRGPGVVALDRGALARESLARAFADEAPDAFGPTRALRALRLLPAWRPRPLARLHLAALLHRLGHGQEALTLARRAHALAPELAPAILARADLERACGEPVNAERLYREAAARLPGAPGPWLGLGDLAFRRGDGAALVACAREALARAQDGASVEKAVQSLLNGHEMARDPVELRRALAGHEVRPALRQYYLGVAARMERDLARAERCYREALALEPGLAPALGHLAAVESEQGDLEAAEDALTRLVAVAPRDRDAWRDLGNVRAARGRIEGEAGAVTAWRRSAEVDPREVDALLALARARAESDPAEARASVSEALRRNPKHPDALRLGRQLGVVPKD